MFFNQRDDKKDEFGYLNSLKKRITFEESDNEKTKNEDKSTEQNDNSKGTDTTASLDNQLADVKDMKDKHEEKTATPDSGDSEEPSDDEPEADDSGTDSAGDGSDDFEFGGDDDSSTDDSSSDDSSSDSSSDSSDTEPMSNTKSTLFMEFTKIRNVIKNSIRNLEKRQPMMNNKNIRILITHFETILQDIEYLLEKTFNTMNESELYFQLEVVKKRTTLALEQLKRINDV